MVEVERHEGDGGINPAVDQISSRNDSIYLLYTGNGLYGITIHYNEIDELVIIKYLAKRL